MRVNPGDALDCSLYVDIRIAEEEPEEEPEVDRSSNHNFVLSPCFLLVVPLISLCLRRNPGRRIDRINSVASDPIANSKQCTQPVHIIDAIGAALSKAERHSPEKFIFTSTAAVATEIARG